MAQQRVKNQHYVSQFYLRKFSADQKKVFVFDKPTGKVFPKSIDEVASTNYFYEIDPKLLPPDAPFQLVEKALAEQEGQFSTELDAFLASVKQGYLITDAQRAFLADWIALQETRTLEFGTKYNQAMMKGLSSLRPHFEKAPNASELEEAIESASDTEKLKLDQAKHMFGELRHRIAAVISDHYWYVGRTTDNDPFFTSDSPLIHIPHVRDPFSGGGGFASLGVELVFPLSSKFALLMYERSFHKSGILLNRRVVDLDPPHLAQYNYFQTYQCNRQVYCASDNFDVARRTIAEHPDCREVDRSRVLINGKRV